MGHTNRFTEDVERTKKNTICKGKCQFVFFTTTKYGIDLINSNKRYFKYDLVWEKHQAVGFLSCNKMPLRAHEMIYIFNKGNIDDINI